MRAPKNAPKATSGQSFVKGQFEDLGWGAVPNPEHDLGTDLWLMARDMRRFELGAIVGAQVKTGPSYFEEPETVDGQTTGWWYREDDAAHFNYWCDHNAPHILVLHRPEDRVSFWVETTTERVQSTGKGRKILVPITSTVDSDHFDDLLAVASSKANVPQWEGSAWRVGRELPDESRLRYALLTPRLVAPHPNSKADEVSADQAIAMLVQMRLQNLNSYAKTQPLVDPDAISETETIQWRLYAGLNRWILKGDSDDLKALASEDSSPSERSAIAVCVAHAFMEVGQPEDAIVVLNAALEKDDANPVDHGWLAAQKARCLFEAGALEEARELALEVQVLSHVAPQDPTAKVLAGSAVQLIFNTGDWMSRQVAELVQSSDNVASWWRSQVQVHALSKQFDQSFKDWGNDSSVTIGAEDVVWTRLRSSMLMAGYAADAPAWRSNATRLAQRQLMTAEDDESPAWAIDLLRLAGADKDVNLAVNRLLEFGPIGPVIKVAQEVDLSKSTRSSLKADLTFLTSAADVLPVESCDRHARWALAVLADLEELAGRLRPQFSLRESIVRMLGELLLGTSEAVQAEVLSHIVNLPTIEDQLVAGRYARLIGSIDSDAWTDDQLAALNARAEGDNFELQRAIEGLVAEHDSAFRATLIAGVEAGDFAALANFGNVTDLPEAAAAGMISHVAAAVAQQTADARQGSFGMGRDLLRTLVLLNAWHPHQANWSACEEALAEPKVTVEHLVGGIAMLGRLASQIPDDVRDRLRPLLEAIVVRDPARRDPFGLFVSDADARGESATALAQLFPDAVREADLLQLVRGSAPQRAAAVQIVVAREDSTQLNLLSALSLDKEIAVRAAVAQGLATWVARGVGGETARDVLAALLREPGTKLGIYVSRALVEDLDDAEFSVLTDQLRNHPSAIVRARIAALHDSGA